jgi:hypothetical protein
VSSYTYFSLRAICVIKHILNPALFSLEFAVLPQWWSHSILTNKHEGCL